MPHTFKRPIIPILRSGPKGGDENVPDPANVQGDVYLTLPKRFEQFLFFTIKDTTQFRLDLSQYIPHITSSGITAERIIEITGPDAKEDCDYSFSNIAFSRAGLNTLGIEDKLNDLDFDNSGFTTIPHGVILVTAKTEKTVQKLFETILSIFKESITVLGTPFGHHRDGGREFFGWRDGISQPALDGLTDPTPGQLVVQPGVIILGYPGDPNQEQRPDFAKDGSFLVYRQLRQDVWLFNEYVEENWESVPANPAPGYCLSDDQRKSLFCARLFGRFASGVPLALSPYIDDPAFLNNDLIDYFDYSERPAGTGCPLFSHVLKTNPRKVDPEVLTEKIVKAAVIVRAGIPYGPEFTEEEQAALKTLEKDKKDQFAVDRGLLFVCYQASISNGFLTQLNDWARQDNFPPGFGAVGQDPIIGQPQVVQGDSNATQDGGSSDQPVYVRQLDAGYYFTPSIPTVKLWARAD